MSVASTLNRNNYIGAGSTATYGYGFKIFASSHLQVIVRLISTGAETTLAETTHYTVSGVGATAGGNVVLVSGGFAWQNGSGYLLSTYEISIRRVVPLKQEIPFRNLAEFYPEYHENALDLATMAAQQQQDAIDRSLKLPATYTNSDWNTEIPASFLSNSGYVYNSGPDGLSLVAGINTEIPNVSGTSGSPNDIVAGTGVPFSGVYWRNIYFIQGSGGPVTVAADPRIAAGSNVGQSLLLIGCSDANYVDIADGQGVSNGNQTLRHINGTISSWVWIGSVWLLVSTNGL